MASSRTTTRKNRSRTRGSEQQTRFGRIQSVVRDTVSEIKKVTWPDKETTRNLTMVVIAMAVLLGTLLGGIDAMFVRLWENIPVL